MKKHFVTFASSDLEQTRLRIEAQAISLGVFDHVHCCTEDDLDPEFRQRFAQHLRLGTRGYGYWCWKPQILLQIIQEAQDGDIVLYCDAGCELNPKGIDILESYFRDAEVSESGFLVFQLEAPGIDPSRFTEEKWTKEDLFAQFGILQGDPIRSSNQMISGVFVFRVSEPVRELIKKWLEIYYLDFDLATDKASKLKNFGEFKEHRHDQSIFSLLIKGTNSKVRSDREIESLARGEDGIESLQPILAARNKQFTFLSRIKIKFGRLVRKLHRIFS